MIDAHLVRGADEVIQHLGPLNERFAGKTILLTGAAGFLGSHFVHYFARLNQAGRISTPCRLLAMDNYLRGRPGWLSAMENQGGVSVFQADVVSTTQYLQADFIVHAASVASPIFYRKFPIETMDANVTGLRNLLDHAVRQPVEGFLFFSSSEIYGDPDPANIPTKETYRGNVSCTGPRACYDESKRYGETLCVNFWQRHQVPVKVVRPFNNYGPGLRISDRRVLPDFFRDVLASRDITLLSDGRATRTFCYVSDAVQGYLRVLLSGHHGEAFNIGTESPEIAMLDLAQMVIKVSGRPLRVQYQQSADPAYLTDNPYRRCPDLTKARQLVHYQPGVALEEGLRRTYDFYLDNPEE